MWSNGILEFFGVWINNTLPIMTILLFSPPPSRSRVICPGAAFLSSYLIFEVKKSICIFFFSHSLSGPHLEVFTILFLIGKRAVLYCLLWLVWFHFQAHRCHISIDSSCYVFFLGHLSYCLSLESPPFYTLSLCFAGAGTCKPGFRFASCYNVGSVNRGR